MHFERHFTVEEAEAMLDEIKDILSEIRRLRISLDMQLADLEKLIQTADRNGGGKAAGPYLDDVLRLSSAISRISSRGVFIKDLELGLVDFPHIRDGEEVFLCWRLGEDSIGYWHNIDAGFKGRRPL